MSCSCTVTSVPSCKGESHTGCSPGQCSVFHCCSWAAVPSPALPSGYLPLWALQETGDLCCGELTDLLLCYCTACIIGRWVCVFLHIYIDLQISVYIQYIDDKCMWVCFGCRGKDETLQSGYDVMNWPHQLSCYSFFFKKFPWCLFKGLYRSAKHSIFKTFNKKYNDVFVCQKAKWFRWLEIFLRLCSAVESESLFVFFNSELRSALKFGS